MYTHAMHEILYISMNLIYPLRNPSIVDCKINYDFKQDL
jgi:hypothetical protein